MPKKLLKKVSSKLSSKASRKISRKISSRKLKTPINKLKYSYEIRTDIGLEDPNGLNLNPLTNQPYQNLYINDTSIGVKPGIPRTYAGISTIWTSKTVYQNRKILYDAFTNSQVILAVSGTSSGKTIIIPRIALHAFDYKEKVICCCPKRLPTRTNASFVAGSMDVNLGEEIGFYYQGTNMTNKNGKESKLIFTTTGSLISRLTGSDPTLADYKCIIVDEAHERGVQTDQLILLLKRLCVQRPDMKIIIMSATISLQTFRDYFPKNKYRFSEVDLGGATSYPIQDKWLDKPSEDWKATAITITMNILRLTSTGDIMIFVKSAGDANQLCNLLDKAMVEFRKKLVGKSTSISISGSVKVPLEYQINPICVKLEGSSNKQEQNLATDAELYKTMKDPINGFPYTRKIVITTNVAESSVTVEGIVYIIDSGYEFTDGYEPNARVRSLLENKIAQSAVIQRRGRAGRTQPGYCFHLYTKREQDSFQEYPTPSIEKSDITGDILNLMRLQEANTVKKLRVMLDDFISPPHEKFILNSLRTLHALGAITNIQDNGTITSMGFALSRFRSINVTHARALVASYFYGVSRSICDIIALIQETDGRLELIFQEPRVDKKKKPEVAKREMQKWIATMKSFSHPLGDYMTLLKAYRMYLKVAQKLPTSPGELAHNQEPEQLVEDLGVDAGEDIINEDEEDIKQAPSVRKWCKEHFLNATRLKRVQSISKQLYFTLQQITRPLHHKSKHPQNKHPQNKHPQNKKSVKQETEIIKNDVDTTLTELEPVGRAELRYSNRDYKSIIEEKTPIIDEQIDEQIGGFMGRIKEYEDVARLETNVRRFATEDENIMMCLALGNYVNLAIKSKQGEGVYVSCFAQTKKFTKINPDSFMVAYGKTNKLPNVIMYDEMFQSSHEARYLKLNLVNKIPDNVFSRIKELYGSHIKYCI